MKIALYIGSHAKDTLSVRLGWWLTRAVQRGPNKMVTHCEAIHGGTAQSCTIASASVRDKGVRRKTVPLTPGNWRIYDVPMFDVDRSIEWFKQHDGEPYSMLGAAASALVFLAYQLGQFCSKSVAASVGAVGADDMTPQELADLCVTFGADITQEFFNAGTN